MATGAVIARILTQYSDKGSKAAQKDLKKLGNQFDAFAKKTKKSFGIAIAASAALSIKIGSDAVKAAIEDSKSQLILANAMMNTTGATKEAVAAAEEYIKVTQFRVNQSDTALRASLATLYVATKDITEAQRLQTIALDVAAATGKDLQSVTVGITKAQQGNVSVLKKLSPELSGLINKATKAEDIFAILGATYAGTAEQLANLDPLTTLQLAYGEILETVGLKLLPVVQKFVDEIVNVVIPAVEKWVQTNGTDLTGAFEGAMQVGLKFLDIVGRILRWADKYKDNLDDIVRISAVVFTIANIGVFLANLGLVLTAWTAIASATTVAATATAIASFGTAVAAGLGALAMTGLGIATWKATDATNGYNTSLGVTTDYVSKLTEKTYGGAAAEKYKAEVLAASAAKAQKIREAQEKAAAASAAKAAAAAKKQAAIDAKTAALKAQIEKKYNLKITDPAEYENIQLTAVEKLLSKQKDADKTLTDRIKLRKEELALFEAINKNAERYTDLLTALADEKLSTQEIELLAKKWGMSIEAAKTYIYTIFAIKDNKVSDDEVAKLAQAWGISTREAGMYLDFISKLRDDGKISDSDLQTLMGTWKLTKQEAERYKDVIYKIESDGDISDKDITDLAKAWGVGNKEVLDYLNKIKAPATYSGTLFEPADIAFNKWRAANNELDAYLAKLKLSSGGVPPTTTTVPPTTTTTTPTTVAAAVSAISTATTTAAINAAVADATKAGVSASEIANSMVTGLLNQGVSTQNALSSARYTGQAIAAQQREEKLAAAAAERERVLSSFKASEALSAINDAVATRDYDERFRFQAFQGSSTLDGAKGLMGSSMSGSTAPVININVAGSVTTENDLVQTVRNGLLAGQTNGQSLTLQEI